MKIFISIIVFAQFVIGSFSFFMHEVSAAEIRDYKLEKNGELILFGEFPNGKTFTYIRTALKNNLKPVNELRFGQKLVFSSDQIFTKIPRPDTAIGHHSLYSLPRESKIVVFMSSRELIVLTQEGNVFSIAFDRPKTVQTFDFNVKSGFSSEQIDLSMYSREVVIPTLSYRFSSVDQTIVPIDKQGHEGSIRQLHYPNDFVKNRFGSEDSQFTFENKNALSYRAKQKKVYFTDFNTKKEWPIFNGVVESFPNSKIQEAYQKLVLIVVDGVLYFVSNQGAINKLSLDYKSLAKDEFENLLYKSKYFESDESGYYLVTFSSSRQIKTPFDFTSYLLRDDGVSWHISKPKNLLADCTPYTDQCVVFLNLSPTGQLVINDEFNSYKDTYFFDSIAENSMFKTLLTTEVRRKLRFLSWQHRAYFSIDNESELIDQLLTMTPGFSLGSAAELIGQFVSEPIRRFVQSPQHVHRKYRLHFNGFGEHAITKLVEAPTLSFYQWDNISAVNGFDNLIEVVDRVVPTAYYSFTKCEELLEGK